MFTLPWQVVITRKKNTIKLLDVYFVSRVVCVIPSEISLLNLNVVFVSYIFP